MTARQHVLTIGLEEHFQLPVGGRGVPERHWDKFPSRLGRNADAALDILARHGTRATFFADRWVAARHPEVLARIAAEGHEIACRFGPAEPSAISDAQVRAAKEAVEAASGFVALGCRTEPGPGWLGSRAHLAGAGFLYECSLQPAPAVAASAGVAPLQRLAVPAIGTRGMVWPRNGGLSVRQMTEGLFARAVLGFSDAKAPQVFDFRIWELDPETPRLSILGAAQRLICYRNLDLFADRLSRLVEAAPFSTVRAHFGLAPEALPEATAAPAPLPVTKATATAAGRDEADADLTIVIPCFNEESGLSFLAAALADLDTGLGRMRRLSFVLVDDGSTDGTWAAMERLFGEDPRFRLVRHGRNRGIGAAVLTGIAAAEAETVAVIDSDCSYDPARIADMLPLLAPDVALVTASPYHADGGVEGVPEWRLVLSRGASRLYRMVLRNKLATYTSCFRVCRKSALAGLTLRHEGYIGVVEMLARLDLAGWKIVEHPVLLETRLLGRSKLRVLKAIAGHLRFLGEISVAQITDRQGAARARR